MADQYYAKPGPITPVALPGHRVAVWTSPRWAAYTVLYLEPLPRSNALIFDGGAVAAGATRGNLQLATLELGTSPLEMAQLRGYVLDDIRVTLKRGQGDTRFKTLNLIANLDIFLPKIDPCLHESEFIVVGDEEPWLDIVNPTDYALAQTRIALFGFKFTLVKIKDATFPSVEEAQALAPITFISAGGM